VLLAAGTVVVLAGLGASQALRPPPASPPVVVTRPEPPPPAPQPAPPPPAPVVVEAKKPAPVVVRKRTAHAPAPRRSGDRSTPKCANAFRVGPDGILIPRPECF
jgi:hypothetical protein